MLNETIKALRKSKGLSQQELAVKVNVVRQTISKWEQGLSVPDSDLLIALSEALETPGGPPLAAHRGVRGHPGRRRGSGRGKQSLSGLGLQRPGNRRYGGGHPRL